MTNAKLDELTDTQKAWVCEIAANSRVIDVVDALKEQGFDVSPATVSRFLRRERERLLVEEGEEMKGSVSALAERGKEGTLREGSLEAVRQRLYEQTLASNDPEEALKLYAAMQKEDGKLKELEIEARKVAVAEEQVRLLRAKLNAEGRTKTVVESSDGVVDAPALEEAGVWERERALFGLIEDLGRVLNGGGEAGEKINEARRTWAEGVKRIGAMNGPKLLGSG